MKRLIAVLFIGVLMVTNVFAVTSKTVKVSNKYEGKIKKENSAVILRLTKYRGNKRGL